MLDSASSCRFRPLHLLSVVLLLPLVCLAAYAGTVAWLGLREGAGRADLAVVLGSKVYPDGTPSAGLRGRLDRALELYRAGQAGKIMVTGNAGEVPVMARYLRERGVAREDLLEDHLGFNTAASARDVAAAMRAGGFRSVIAVSQFFHLPRCRLAFRRAGITRVSTAHSRQYDSRDAYGLLRELVALPWYALRMRPAQM